MSTGNLTESEGVVDWNGIAQNCLLPALLVLHVVFLLTLLMRSFFFGPKERQSKVQMFEIISRREIEARLAKMIVEKQEENRSIDRAIFRSMMMEMVHVMREHNKDQRQSAQGQADSTEEDDDEPVFELQVALPHKECDSCGCFHPIGRECFW